ncbi:hypothetical protein M0R89_12520 [Halorussus limi]|uniref:DUF7322 domain-containing protein n=1 Tax=Halorussus limi TaxID=2938695 RepID=A0A8U0HR34_9EURY|nr:hypothetical protein [Halorussus limi]UPV73367.1 hypothetical protein M0R89_12520 [Halorussus limi]
MAPDDSTPDDSEDPVAELLPEDPPQAEADLLPDDPAENLGPDPPRVPDTSSNDADPEVKRKFWSLVIVFNVALFGMSLGLMLAGFEGRWRVGGAMFAVGAFAFLRGWHGYRNVRDESDDDGGDDSGDADDSDASVADDAELQKD